VQYPSNVFFYLEVALIEITFRLDQAKQKQVAPVQSFNTSTVL
jgi:hypothetical protein